MKTAVQTYKAEIKSRFDKASASVAQAKQHLQKQINEKRVKYSPEMMELLATNLIRIRAFEGLYNDVSLVLDNIDAIEKKNVDANVIPAVERLVAAEQIDTENYGKKAISKLTSKVKLSTKNPIASKDVQIAYKHIKITENIVVDEIYKLSNDLYDSEFLLLKSLQTNAHFKKPVDDILAEAVPPMRSKDRSTTVKYGNQNTTNIPPNQLSNPYKNIQTIPPQHNIDPKAAVIYPTPTYPGQPVPSQPNIPPHVVQNVSPYPQFNPPPAVDLSQIDQNQPVYPPPPSASQAYPKQDSNLYPSIEYPPVNPNIPPEPRPATPDNLKSDDMKSDDLKINASLGEPIQISSPKQKFLSPSPIDVIGPFSVYQPTFPSDESSDDHPIEPIMPDSPILQSNEK